MIFQFALFGSGGQDPTSINNAYQLFPLLQRVVNIALMLIGAVAFLYILIAGIQYMLAAGEEGKQAEAKRTITAAIVGLFIVFGAFALTNWLLHTLQVSDTIKQTINSGSQNNSGPEIIPK